jgi:hypothetical protein
VAGRTAHNLKGMTGIVPVPDLLQAAGTLNEAALRGTEWMDAAIALEEIVAATLKRFPAKHRAAPQPCQAGAGQDLYALLPELKRLLQRRSLSARTAVDNLHGVLGPTPAVLRIETAVRGLDFNAAMEAVTELAEARGIPLTTPR